jgi:hypothetical protein
MVRIGLLFFLLPLAALAVPAPLQPAGPPPAGPAPFAIRAVALAGQPAPGGGVFTQFSDPALNAGGSLAFAALTSRQEAHAGLYVRINERISTLATSGQAAPTGGAFRVFNDVVLSDRDTVLFLGRTTDRVAHQGLYLARNGTVVPVVATGQPAPGGGEFTDFANPTINARDVVAFVGRIGQGGREGIFTSSEGSIVPVALSGQPTPLGGTFQFFVDGSPAQNDRGEIAFVAAVAPRGTFGIFVLVGGRPVPVVTTEDEAPAGGAFTEFGSLMLSNPGTVGFVGRTSRSSVREGLYVSGRATLVTLAQQGQAVAGEVLTAIATSAMNDQESVVFELATPDPIPRAIFLATRAGVRIVVRARDRAPSGRGFIAFGSPAINARGQIAFVAETDDQQHGIYLMTPK